MPAFHVQRSIEINASPQQVFDTISDYGTWTKWSPWLVAEPEARVTVSDNSSTVGSTYSWAGQVVGQGELEHMLLEPGKRIEDEIRFIKPFKSVSQVTFEIDPVEYGTRVSWNMNGSMPWFMFWMVPSMKIFIGMDYERGLKMLKEWIETGTIQATTTVKGIEPVDSFMIAGVRRSCSMKDIGPSMQQAFSEVAEKITGQDLSPDACGVSVYHNMDVKKGVVDYTSGFIVPETAQTQFSNLSTWTFPGGNAFRVDHLGSYDHLGNAWSAAVQNVRYKKLKQSKVGDFEIYRNNPCDTDPAELMTEVYLPLK